MASLHSLTGFRSLLLEELSLHKPLSATLLIALSVFIAVRYIRSPWRSLPPGPTGLSLIRDARRLATNRWLIFTEWGRTYGDLVYFNILGQRFLVLNSHKAAVELLDRRAGIYSDRPRSIVAGEIMTGGFMLVFTRYNDTWRRHQKAAQESLNKGLVVQYHHAQTVEAQHLVRGILADPGQWKKHFRRTTASVMKSIIYDSRSVELEDTIVTYISNMVVRLARAWVPGAHLVEFMPFLKAVPSRFAKWKREAEEWYARDSATFEQLFTEVYERIARGDERPSFSATLIKEADRYGLPLRENAWLAATLFAAGFDSANSALKWWLLAMSAYPDVQKRAQAELDNVVGRDRLPSFADMDHLPYIRAMVKETLRWHPITPGGVPHRLMQDDWYEGHFIPKGTLVFSNVWHLNRDREFYGEDAAQFNPARYVDRDARAAPSSADAKDEGHFTYGFGRRTCPGRHVANNLLFIDIAMMLWAVNIERHLDADSTPTPLDLDVCIDDGAITHPIPFECNITPRFPEVTAILELEKELLEGTELL